MPSWVQARNVSSTNTQGQWKNRTRAMRSVYDEITAIRDMLVSQGRWDNTYLIVTSDSGFMLGEHKLDKKFSPYAASIRMPFVIHGPGISAGRTDRLAHLVDISPTIYPLTGTPAPHQVDGENLLEPQIRSWLFAQWWNTAGQNIPNWQMRWNTSRKEVRYSTDGYATSVFREAFDVASDPGELTNLRTVDDAPLEQLAHCRGPVECGG